MIAESSPSQSVFRRVEKHFKNRQTVGKKRVACLPSLRQHGVIDLSRRDEVEDEVQAAGWWGSETPEDRFGGRNMAEIRLTDGKTGWVLGEGCILIPGCLTPSEQIEEMERALSSYTLPPNPMSISTHYDVPPNLFELYAANSDDCIQPRHTTMPVSPSLQRTSLPDDTWGRRTIETLPGSQLGYEQILAANKDWSGDKPSERLKPVTAERLMRDLRWTNLGWVYQWTTKAYDFTCEEPIPFPKLLGDRCSNVVAGIPWAEVSGDTRERMEQPDWQRWSHDYDTGIVNFYQLKDTLMGHVDRAELDPSRPLVSVSLGHACIFLLGSSSKDQEPIPVILRSGDILIMSGPSRSYYHGVPRVLEGSLPQHFRPSADDAPLRAACKRWISTGRININARQVFPPGFQRPPVS